MGLATYAIIAAGDRWGILHDGNVEGDHVTKESAFEAAVAAASLAIRQGHEVSLSVPGLDEMKARADYETVGMRKSPFTTSIRNSQDRS